MKLLNKTENAYQVELTLDELTWINNALNETMGAIDPEEFHARTGGTPEDFKKLLEEIGSL